MNATNHRFPRLAPQREVRTSLQGRTLTWLRPMVALIKKDPLIILVGIFDALFYGSVIALLARL